MIDSLLSWATFDENSLHIWHHVLGNYALLIVWMISLFLHIFVVVTNLSLLWHMKKG